MEILALYVPLLCAPERYCAPSYKPHSKQGRLYYAPRSLARTAGVGTSTGTSAVEASSSISGGRCPISCLTGGRAGGSHVDIRYIPWPFTRVVCVSITLNSIAFTFVSNILASGIWSLGSALEKRCRSREMISAKKWFRGRKGRQALMIAIIGSAYVDIDARKTSSVCQFSL